ncbi:MAG: 3-methyl-2-oxobutanoate hydroxymethyltransferase [Chloroflexi bacterium]|nr:3-methyl-2-oxobutanoate hydroxymethyltransferase [Chloroflexota bacterium]|tara:strand:+ start:2586 stop:3452 length:867 start_codon:yes stop_codon:yes gene_type:complete
MTERKKITLPVLRNRKKNKKKISWLTAYDFATARFADEAGIDMILVGDSGGMTMMGKSSTISVTMEDMIMFTKSVVKGSDHCFIVGDLPYMSYQISDEDAVRNAGRLMAIGCDAVKLEGGDEMSSRITAISNAGIPVVSHLGLTPQSLAQIGGYRIQGRSLSSFKKLLKDILAVEKAGAVFHLLECVPEEVTAEIYKHVKNPLYGIGSGRNVDGQLVISHDMLGLFVGDVDPKFVKKYADLSSIIKKAFSNYKDDIEKNLFPEEKHLYSIEGEDLKQIVEYSNKFSKD